MSFRWRRSLFCEQQETHKRPGESCEVQSGERASSWSPYVQQGLDKQRNGEVDWDRLYGVMDQNPDGYRTWLSKQYTRYYGMWVQVRYYSGNINWGVSWQNCGKKVTLAPLCLSPNEDKVQIFREEIDELKTWLEKQDKTNIVSSYWLPMSWSLETHTYFKTWMWCCSTWQPF